MSVSARRVADGPGGGLRFHYLVRWRDDQRIEHARMFATEGDAVAFDSDMKGRPGRASQRAARVVPDVPGRGDGLAGHQTGDQAGAHRGQVRVAPAAARPAGVRAQSAAAITRRDVQQWINTLARDDLSPSTIGDIYRGVFKPVLSKAILDGLLAVSPCHRIELPQPVAEEVVPPTPEQVLAVIGALPVRYRAMAAIAAGAERGSPRPPGSRSVGCAVPGPATHRPAAAPGPPGYEHISGRVPDAPDRGPRCRARWGPPKSAAGVRDQPVPALIASPWRRTCGYGPAPCGCCSPRMPAPR